MNLKCTDTSNQTVNVWEAIAFEKGESFLFIQTQMTTCAENSSFGLFFKTFDQQHGPSEICMHVMNLSLPHMRTRTLCAVSKSTDSLNNDGRQHCLWGFDFHHTAHMNKSFKAALPSLLFHLRVQKKLKLLGACPVWWTESLNKRSN